MSSALSYLRGLFGFSARKNSMKTYTQTLIAIIIQNTNWYIT